MAVPQDLLNQLSSLQAPLTDVQASIDGVLAAGREHVGLTKDAAMNGLENATGAWLERSDAIETQLLVYLSPSEEQEPSQREDAADALGRLCGLSILHVAVMSDLGLLARLDSLQPDEVVDAVLSESQVVPSAIQNAAFGDGGLLEALRTETVDNPGTSQPSEESVANELIDRAGHVTGTVLIGMVPGASAVLGAALPGLHAAMNVVPQQFENLAGKTIKRIVGLIKVIMRQVRKVLSAVFSGYQDIVQRLIGKLNDEAEEFVVEPIIRRLAGWVFNESHITSSIRIARLKRTAPHMELNPATGRFEAQPTGKVWISDDERRHQLRKLAKANKRWVGPAGVVAHGLDALWAVPIGVVPAAPIAGCVLLAWTYLVTGDQLDADGPFPNFWAGVIAIARM